MFHELKFTARKPATANPEILVTVRATVCLGNLDYQKLGVRW